MLRTRSTASRPTAFQARSRSGRRLYQAPYSTRHTDTTPHGSPSLPSPQNASAADTPATTSVPQQPQGQGSRSSPPPIDVETLQRRVRDWSVLASTSLRQRADELSRQTTTTFSHLGQHLNRVTGYEAIEVLKRQVVEQEAQIKATRRATREAKTAHDDAVRQRSVSQRQVNDLLQRKSSWTDADVGHFTSLVRSDHSFEQDEVRTKAHVAETEDAVDREFSELMRVILARYHEEQVWSDKIRSASTYGSLAVLGVNLMVFIMAIIVVEPWKRKRLAQTFEKKVEEMGVEMKTLVDAGATRLEEQLTRQENKLAELITRLSGEARQGVSTATAPKEAPPEETPATLSPPPSWWSQVYFSYPYMGVIGGRELVLVVGSAAVGGLMTLLTRSIFAN